jgi:uncharacterized protein with FMN-binding domain
MRRAIAAFLVTAAVVALLVSFKARSPAIGTLSAAQRPTTTPARASTPTPAKTAPSRKRKRTSTTTSRRSATGAAISTRYGEVQVAVTTVSGRVTDVRTLVMSFDNGRSQEIDAQAEPLLRQEALQAGSAQIDLVSGATYTSEGYVQSLQSAIDRARVA